MPEALGEPGIVEQYLALGLALGRHIDGLVDAYYGPRSVSERVAEEPKRSPMHLRSIARSLIADIDAGEPLQSPESTIETWGSAASAAKREPGAPAADDPLRRRWIRAQVVGLETTARKLAGEKISYADEVEWCYGVRPTVVPEEKLQEAQEKLDAALPGSGPLAERYINWREAQAVPVELLQSAIASLADDLRERTNTLFGLPDGEHIDFELVTGQPWSGFNYYKGDLHSLVQINTDLPVLSISLAHLVAHEAYPGHHTEHSRKEVGLVRAQHRYEETIFMVGTPQCLLAEGLADLGLQVVMGRRPEQLVAQHLRPLGIKYDPEVVAAVSEAGEALGGVRANAAFRLHQDGADVETVIDEISRWGLLPRARAAKAVEFLVHPTWRAYVNCYSDGLRLCREFVGEDPLRFGRLLTEQLLPADLQTA